MPDQSQFLLQAASTPNQPAEIAAIQAHIEDYLDHVFAPLVDVMPWEQRREHRREMHTHLTCLVSAYQELGDSPEQAVEIALRQFGSPQSLSQQWQREWELTHPSQSAAPATGFAFYSFGIATILTYGLLLLTGSAINYTNGNGAWLRPLLFLYLPVLAGSYVGIHANSRPVRSAFVAICLLSLPTALFYQIWANHQTFNDPIGAGFFWSAVQLTFWMVFGSAAAGVSGWIRRSIRRPRRRFVSR